VAANWYHDHEAVRSVEAGGRTVEGGFMAEEGMIKRCWARENRQFMTDKVPDP
jgi:hypothetical protein